MKTISTELVLSMASWFLLCAVLALMPACSAFGEETGTCSTTCFSESTGNNLGTVTYDNYTRKECEQALESRQTILTRCTMAWE